jgi:tetratricopeptide (TPR) repeat protein
LHEIIDAPDFSSPAVDAGFHDYWARGLVSGDWTPPDGYSDPKIQTNPYLRPPGYPYFLAFLYFLSGSSYLVSRLFQMCLGLLNCVVAWLIGRYLFGRAVGLIFTAFMSVYWVFIYFEGEFLEPVLLVFLLLLAVVFLFLWLRKFAFYYLLLASLCFGLAALSRPNCLLFLPMMFLWVCWIAHKSLAWRGVLITALILVLGIAVAIAPVTIRNYIVADDFVLISSNAGINLLIGNCNSAEGEFTMFYLPGHGSFGTCYDYHIIVELFEKKIGTPLKHSQVSRHLANIAFRYIKAHPVRTLKLTLKKAALFWGPREISHNKDVKQVRQSSYILRNIPMSFPCVLSLCLVGVLRFLFDIKQQRSGRNRHLALTKECRQLSIFIVLFVIIYFLSYLPFFVTALYRVPIIPFLLLFGAYGLHRIFTFIITKDFLRTAVWSATAIALYLIATVDAFPSLGQAGVHQSNGVHYLYDGQWDMAINEFNEALRLKPDYSEAYYNLGFVHLVQNKLEEAIVYFEKALQLKPNYTEAHDNLGSVFLRLGKFDKAIAHHNEALRLNPDGMGSTNLAISLNPGYVEVYIQISAALARQGNTEKALEYLQHAIRMRPDSSRAYFMLGLVLSERGSLNDAVRYLIAATRLDPNSPLQHYKLGEVFAKQEELDRAIACYTKAIRLKADYAEAHHSMANALLRKGNTAEAIIHYKEVLRISPDDKAARTKLAEAQALLEEESK